jgi:hypothetical protein
LKDIFSPVKIAMKELPVNFDGKIAVENRFHFTDLNQCSFQWALVNYYKPQDPFAGYKVEQKGTVHASSIKPLANGDCNYRSLPITNLMMRWYWLHSIHLKKRSTDGTGKLKTMRDCSKNIIVMNDSDVDN